MPSRILAMGGRTAELDDLVLELAGPRICFVATASGEPVAGSACPHYDGEERRRPVYRTLVDDGFPAGYAADDGVGLLFGGTELVDVVSAVPEARAYRVEPGSETPLDARLL